MKDRRMHDGTKLLYHMDRVIDHFDRGRRVAPIHIDCGISKACNINCSYCYRFFQQPENTYIRRGALLQMIRDADEIGVRSMALIGDGDPTCNPYLYEALDVSMGTNVSMAISTNGALVDNDEKAMAILESCEWMRFCISAGTREGYQQIHGRDCFDKVCENIARMVELKKKHKLACDIGMQSVFVPTLMKEEMVEEAKLAVKLGVDYFVIKQCSLPDAGESGMVQFDLQEYDALATIEALKRCEEMSTEQTDVIVKWNIMRQKGVRPYNSCSSVPFISEISGNGDWYPCGYFFGSQRPDSAPYRFGNVHEMTLKEIFMSEHYWDVIRVMREDFDVHGQCKGSCRLDATNKFCCDYLNKPSGINFI